MNKEITFTEQEIQALFGHEAAEDEDIHRLREYYVKSSTYEQVITDLPLRILVGHKGIGKSAMFQIAMEEDRENERLTVLVKPDDVTDLATDTKDFLKTIRDWKIGLRKIILGKILNSLGSTNETWRRQLAKYTGHIADFLRQTVGDRKGLSLSPVTNLVIEKFLDSGKIYVYIDDLDRGWQGKKPDVLRISALMNAVRDLSTENRGVSFRVSLRSDVYYLYRTSDESTDKIEGSVIWQKWSNHEIFVLLIKRIETFFGRSINEKGLLATHQRDLAHFLDPVIQHRFMGSGHWENAPMYRVLMSLIRKRPRDLVKLCSLAARKAREEERHIITTRDFEMSFVEYSQSRLQDTINEFRSELPDLERLLMNMRPTRNERKETGGFIFTTDQLIKKINNIRQTGQFRFANGETATSKELAAFMYKINFLTARKESPGSNIIVRQYFEENRYLSNQFTDFGFDWEIHPAYRWTLQPESLKDIYATLKLAAESDTSKPNS